MSSSPSINDLEEDVQRLVVQTAGKPISDAIEIMNDELEDTSRSPSVEPGPSSTSRPSLNSLADVGPNERPPYSMHDELEDTSQSPSVEPGPSSTSRPSLNSLADVGSNERPPYSNFTLVKYAILGSAEQKLKLSEIYTAIKDRFPFYRNVGKGWENSVRHCLSLDRQFYKEEQSSGRGCYWKVSVDTPRGNKRQRKRNKKPSRRSLVEHSQRVSQLPTSFPLTTPAFRDQEPAPRASQYATTPRAPRAHDYDDTANVTSTALFRPQPLSESGWTPYFPSNATNSVPTPVLAHFAEVTHPGASPSASSVLSALASSISLSTRTRSLGSVSNASATRVYATVPSTSSASLAPNITLASAPSASSGSPAGEVPIAKAPIARVSPAGITMASASSASSAPRAPSVPQRALSIPRALPASVKPLKLSPACHEDEKNQMSSDDSEFESEVEP